MAFKSIGFRGNAPSAPSAPARPPPPTGSTGGPAGNSIPAPTAPAAPPPPTGRTAVVGNLGNSIPPPTAPGGLGAIYQPSAPSAPAAPASIAAAKSAMANSFASRLLTMPGGAQGSVAATIANVNTAAQQAANQAALANVLPSSSQTTAASGAGGTADDGSSQDDGSSSQDDGSSGSSGDGTDGGSEQDFEAFVQNYYQQAGVTAPAATPAATDPNAQAAAAPAAPAFDPNAGGGAVDPNIAAQALPGGLAQPVAQGGQNGSRTSHPHRGFFARLLSLLSGQSGDEAAATQAAILQAVQQSTQASQNATALAAQAVATANAATTPADDSQGQTDLSGEYDYAPQWGEDPSDNPGQGPVSIYAQNGVITAAGYATSPYGLLPVQTSVQSPVPVSNGPVRFDAQDGHHLNSTIYLLKKVLYSKSLDDAQRDAAAHLVLRVRLGDQNAWAILNEVSENAKKGDPRAVNAQRLVMEFVKKNPNTRAGFAGDTSGAGSAQPEQRAINEMADGPAISAARARDIAATFGGKSSRRRNILFHGMSTADSTESECAKFEARLSKLEKELHKLGRRIGKARNLQRVRHAKAPIAAYDKASAWELGEPVEENPRVAQAS